MHRTCARPLAFVLVALIGLLSATTVPRPVAAAQATQSVPAQPALAVATPESPKVVRQRPCPDSEFTCITLRVLRDHFGPANGPTFDVTFALLRASSGHRKGVFVTITGGPGTSGLAAADSYTAAFDPEIPEDYDLVFLDQRGIGLSEPLQCPQSALAFYTSDAVPTVSAAQARAYSQAARTFARDCVKETGVDPSMLPYFSTRQAVEDLETFRAWLKVDQIELYGESYGTQYVQTYAAAHPDRVHTLYVDGAVDLVQTPFQFLSDQARAFGTVLADTLGRCTATRACRSDVTGRDALATYDALARQLRSGPQTFPFVTAQGTTVTRAFDLSDLETAAAGYVYSTYDRMTLQRAIAQASRGQLLPLARLDYLSLGQDPETLGAIVDPSWSDAMYYAVECMDYDYWAGSAQASAQAFLAAGAKAGMASVRLGSIFYGDLPCAYWPVHPASSQRPPPLTRTPFPILVLGSTWDPATPYSGAARIFQRAQNAYLIVTPGGAHIIFGRGDSCPDELVTARLLDGTLPAARRTTCPFIGSDAYVPIPAAKVTAASDPLEAMGGVDDEINNAADYWAWDGIGRLRYGCLYGGWIRYSATDDGYRLRLDGCAFSAGLGLTGSGEIDLDDGSFALDVRAPGGTDVQYARDADGVRSVSGSWFGAPVEEGD